VRARGVGVCTGVRILCSESTDCKETEKEQIDQQRHYEKYDERRRRRKQTRQAKIMRVKIQKEAKENQERKLIRRRKSQ
jgi:hypothetical protein